MDGPHTVIPISHQSNVSGACNRPVLRDTQHNCTAVWSHKLSPSVQNRSLDVQSPSSQPSLSQQTLASWTHTRMAIAVQMRRHPPPTTRWLLIRPTRKRTATCIGTSVFVLTFYRFKPFIGPKPTFSKRHQFIFVFPLQHQTQKSPFSTVSRHKTALRGFSWDSRKIDSREWVAIRLFRN